MHNTKSVLKNDTHKLLWDSDIQADHLISTRRSDHENNQQRKKKRKKRELATLWTLLSRLTIE